VHPNDHPNEQQHVISFYQGMQFLKPLIYVGLGLAFGLVIIGGKSEQKMLRGSSYSSVHMKNMADTPYIHIDINFPADPNNLGSQQSNEFMPTVHVGSPMMEGENVDVPVPVDVNLYPLQEINQKMPEEVQVATFDTPIAEVSPGEMGAASLEQIGTTIPNPQQQDLIAPIMQQDTNAIPQVANQPMGYEPMQQDPNEIPQVANKPVGYVPMQQDWAASIMQQDTNAIPQVANQPMGYVPMQQDTNAIPQVPNKPMAYVPMQQDWAASIMQQDTNAIPQVAGAVQDANQIQETPMMQDAYGNPQNSTEAESDPSSLETEN